jgi:release factor glutamine methyltransferase
MTGDGVGAPADGAVSWRSLWEDTSRVVGARNVARWLCEAACGADGDEFIDELEAFATERAVAHLDAMIARHRRGEPLQYVLGRWSFRRLDLMVDRRVLIPRPETELLVEYAHELLAPRPRPWRIVDLGTGSGAIGLSCAAEWRHEGLEVWLTDASADALDVARANLAGIGRAAPNVRLVHGSWFEPLPDSARGRLDLIVSNPPYIADDDPDVDVSVREWEPGSALFAGADGLDDLRRIAAEALHWLAPGGAVVVEIGAHQGPAVAELFRAAGAVDVTVRADLSGRDRFVQAKRAAT